MKHIELDRQDERVKQFVLSLALDPDGSVLELHGQPVARVISVAQESVDRDKLREAIVTRRDESRALNHEWQAVDAEAWEKLTAENVSGW